MPSFPPSVPRHLGPVRPSLDAYGDLPRAAYDYLRGQQNALARQLAPAHAQGLPLADLVGLVGSFSQPLEVLPRAACRARMASLAAPATGGRAAVRHALARMELPGTPGHLRTWIPCDGRIYVLDLPLPN